MALLGVRKLVFFKDGLRFNFATQIPYVRLNAPPQSRAGPVTALA
jgi:hypothetical protein